MANKRNLLTIGLVASALVGGAMYLFRFNNQIFVEWAGLKWLGREGLKLRFLLKYRITNNNTTSLTISNFKGQLFYGDYKLNDVVINKSVVIPAQGSENMEVLFSLSPGAVLGELLRFLEDKAGFKRFTLRGQMTGKIGVVPWILPVNENLQMAE